MKKSTIYTTGATLIAMVIINIIGNLVFKRFDLTADHRYTLSETSKKIVERIETPLYVDVFLEGSFPGEFKKLQTETQQLLEEFKAQNPNIVFQFINPLEEESTRDKTIQQFYERGMIPINITVNDKGKQTEELVFPWAVVTYGTKSTKIPLLKNMMGASTAQKVESSVQHLEYAFANGFTTVTQMRKKKIAVIKGNGELHELQIGDFLRNVKENYFIGPFTLDSVASNPNATLKELQKYDLAIIAKPTEAFTDSEKEVLDQFMVNGGKSLWVLDPVTIEMDSLMQSGEGLAIPRDLNLDDLMFKYGVRFKSDLVQDVLACPITLATGQQGSSTQYNQYPWLFAPAVYSDSNHPIVTNLDMIKFDFCSPIEILQNDIKKTILLHSSNYSKALGTPLPVNLNSVADRPEPKDFPKGFGTIPLAVLLEGNFHSVYENRILPFKDATFKVVGKPGKMIVISDGDVVKNQLDKDFQPLELGYDKWTGKMYANKEFLLNCVNYLLDDTGLINIRTKEVHLALLDSNKVKENYTQSQIITVAIPLFILGLFGWIFTVLRKRQYAR
jgi:gliding-associated putative ABC transporter substrate-binding component GldG